jgi:hypothetical protein
MSKQLAISTAFSVLMMASFMLFSPGTARAPLDSGGSAGLFGVEVKAILSR